MRITLSLLIFIFLSFLFTISANADYNSELSNFNNCKKINPNGSCEAVPFFTKKHLINSISPCILPSPALSEIESRIDCKGSVNLISKSCADKFQPQIKQLAGNHCAKEKVQAAQAAEAALPKQAAPAAQAKKSSSRSISSSHALAGTR